MVERTGLRGESRAPSRSRSRSAPYSLRALPSLTRPTRRSRSSSNSYVQVGAYFSTVDGRTESEKGPPFPAKESASPMSRRDHKTASPTYVLDRNASMRRSRSTDVKSLAGSKASEVYKSRRSRSHLGNVDAPKARDQQQHSVWIRWWKRLKIFDKLAARLVPHRRHRKIQVGPKYQVPTVPTPIPPIDPFPVSPRTRNVMKLR